MKSHISGQGVYSSYQKKQALQAIRQQQKEAEEYNQKRNAKVLKIVVILICWVLRKRYHYTVKTLQSIINEVYAIIQEADKKTGIDWTKGVEFWADYMGLNIWD